MEKPKGTGREKLVNIGAIAARKKKVFAGVVLAAS